MSAEGEYGLVMPFVTVASVGGPHDDNSYVAGYEMGQLAARLDQVELLQSEYRPPMPIRRENLRQADLLAMRHSYTMVVDECGELSPGDARNGWAYVTFISSARATTEGEQP
jgi:hypothetical protein